MKSLTRDHLGRRVETLDNGWTITEITSFYQVKSPSKGFYYETTDRERAILAAELLASDSVDFRPFAYPSYKHINHAIDKLMKEKTNELS